jgi:hypothetical protein
VIDNDTQTNKYASVMGVCVLYKYSKYSIESNRSELCVCV